MKYLSMENNYENSTNRVAPHSKYSGYFEVFEKLRMTLEE